LLVEPNQFSDVRIAKIGASYFEILLDTNNVISYISTDDSNFRSNEGLMIGDSFKTVSKKCKVGKENIIKMRGWGNFVKLPSGWCAVFDFKMAVNQKSKILFFFQNNKWGF